MLGEGLVGAGGTISSKTCLICWRVTSSGAWGFWKAWLWMASENLLGAQACVSVGRSPRLSTQTGSPKCRSRTRRCRGGCWLCFRLCFPPCFRGGWESSWTQQTVCGLWRLPSLSGRCPRRPSGSLSLTGTLGVAACFPGLEFPLPMTRESRGTRLLYRELTFCCLPTMVYHNCVLEDGESWVCWRPQAPVGRLPGRRGWRRMWICWGKRPWRRAGTGGRGAGRRPSPGWRRRLG